MSVVPVLLHMQKEAPHVNAMYRKSMITEVNYKNFKASEDMLKAEMADVQAEARELYPGWEAHIWAQAVQMHRQGIARREQAEREEAEKKRAKDAAKKERLRERKKAAKKEEEEKRRAELAEKTAAELIAEEEATRKTASGGKAKKK